MQKLSSQETGFLMSSGDNLSRYASHMYIEDITEWQIAGLRFSIVNPFMRANTQQLSALLCKARELYPRQAQRYIVFDSFDLNRVDWFRDLVARYQTSYNREGFGSWRNRKHEEVLASFFVFSSRKPYVVNRTYLQLLVGAYHAQANASREQPLDGITDLSGMTAVQRKAVSAGKCYLCASPKRRKTVCMVCGYVPSTLE